MKTGLAAMIIAAEEFLQHNSDFKGSIAFLITSAEEDYSDLGTPAVIKLLKERGEKIDYCIVGEPSSTKHLGDTIKIGRRGSLNGNLRIKGTQGHIAYPHLADNPIHKALAALLKLTQNVWDQGNRHFPPTQFQISNIQAGTGTTNVIPGEIKLMFNFRFAPSSTVETLKATVETCLQEAHLNYELDWQLSGEPFYCEDERFIATCTDAVQNITGLMPELSTAGGTSDGRFIAPTGAKVVEIGLINQTIHQVNECTLISDLEKLKDIYLKILLATLAKRD